MSEMNETDRKLAQELLAAWDGSSAHRLAIEQAVNSMSEDAVSMAQTARRLVTAELAATPMADEDALVETTARNLDAASGGEYSSHWCEILARTALNAIRPTLAALQAHAEFLERDGQILQKERNEWREAWGKLMQEHSNKCAALQARAEAAEAENARLRECPKWVGDPAYEPKTLAGKLGYLVEECAEVLAAVGKTQRWGLESFNPEVPPEKRETNREWILREMLDLERAIGMVRAALGDKS